VECFANRTIQVELPNGHRIRAHFPPEIAANPILPGDEVMLEMTPYDMSKGRIVFRQT
jgi:translation initiation factor IF-1